MDSFNLIKQTTKVLLLTTAITCNTWAAKTDIEERIIRAAGNHVQEVADFKVKERNDGRWKEFCTFIHIHDGSVSEIKKSLLMSEYFRDHAKASPDKVLWLMAGGNGVMRLISASQEDVKLYNGNVEQAYKNIVSYSVENGVNNIGDFLKQRQIGETHVDKLVKQIGSLNDEIIGLKSDIGRLNLKVDSLEKANLDFFKQLKSANDKIVLLEANITNLKVEVAQKAGKAETLDQLAKAEAKAKEREAKRDEEHQRVITDERAKAKAELDAAKERENAAKERARLAEQNATLEREKQSVIIENMSSKLKLESAQEKVKMLEEMSNVYKNENVKVNLLLSESRSTYQILEKNHNELMKNLKERYPLIYTEILLTISL